MGVFNQSIDFAAIGSEMAKTALPWMNGSVQIIDPDLQGATWDEFTNQYTGSSGTVLWSGPARIQHLNNSTPPTSDFQQSSIVGIRVQVPLSVDMGFVRKGLQIVVTDGGNDYELEQLQFVVKSAVNSSYAWLRTIEAEVDVKSIANSTWATVSGKVVDDLSNNIANATIRSFSFDEGFWILNYETKSDALGNFELPADVGVDVAVVASKSGFVTQYYDGAASFETASLINPINHEMISGIDFVLVEA